MEEFDSWSESTNFTFSQPVADENSLEGMIRMKMRGGEFTPPRKGRILEDESIPISVPVSREATFINAPMEQRIERRTPRDTPSVIGVGGNRKTFASILSRDFVPKSVPPIAQNSVDGMRERERIHDLQRSEFMAEGRLTKAKQSDDISRLRRWILSAASEEDSSVDLLRSLQALNTKHDSGSEQEPESEAIDTILEKCIKREYENELHKKDKTKSSHSYHSACSDSSSSRSSHSYERKKRRRGRKSRGKSRRKSRHSSSSSSSSSSSKLTSRRNRRIQREQDKVIERLALQNAFLHHNQNINGASQQQHLQQINNEISQYYNSMRDQQAKMISDMRTLMEEDKHERETEMRQAITNLKEEAKDIIKEEAKDIIKDIAKAATPVAYPHPSPLSVPSMADGGFAPRPKIPIKSPAFQYHQKQHQHQHHHEQHQHQHHHSAPHQPGSQASSPGIPPRSQAGTPLSVPVTSPQVVPAVSSAAARPPVNPAHGIKSLHQHQQPQQQQPQQQQHQTEQPPPQPHSAPVKVDPPRQKQPQAQSAPAPAAKASKTDKAPKAKSASGLSISRFFKSKKSDKADKKDKTSSKKGTKGKKKPTSSESDTTETEPDDDSPRPAPSKARRFFSSKKSAAKESNLKPPDCLPGRYIFQLSESSCLGCLNSLELLMQTASRDDDCYAFTGLSSTAISGIEIKEMLQNVCENRPLNSENRKLEKAGAAHLELCKFYDKSGIIPKKLFEKIVKQNGKVKTDSKFEKKYLVTQEKKVAFYGIVKHLKITFDKEPAQGKHRRLAKTYMIAMCGKGVPELPEAKKEYLADFLLNVIKSGVKEVPTGFQMPTPVGPPPPTTSIMDKQADSEGTSSDDIQSVSEPTASDKPPPRESRKPSPPLENSSDDEPVSEKFVPSGSIDGYRLRKTPPMRANIMNVE